MEHDKLHEERCHSRQPLSPASYTSSVGATTINLVSPTRSLDFNARSRQAGYDLKTSTELLKVLNRIWCLEEQHAADVSAMKGLKRELQHAQSCIQELMQERQQYHHEFDSLARQVTEDKMARRNKDQEKIRAALCSLQEELADERRLRKHSETLHRRLGKELSEIKSAFGKAVKALEKEKKATCLLEDLCDEFSTGIRNYEEEVRVLKQRHVKEYKHKFDKSVVHISEAWLDERMQMQKADVREDSSGKTSITERLNSEIESFLHHAKRSGSSKSDNLDVGNEKRDASLCRQSLESVHLNAATSAPRLAEDDDGTSAAGDLHCFELNMHRGAIKSHDLAGTRQRVTSSMHSPMRRLEYSKKDRARSSIGRQQFIGSTPEISSRNDADEQNETVMTQVSRRLRDDLLKIKTEAPQHAYLGQKSNHPRTNQLHEYTTSRDLCDVRSPARQLNNQGKLLDLEISESPAHRQLGVKENTLKAKLLQARLEGQHARTRASVYPLISTRRK
uniref:Intracellular protein transport protein USO1 n=1 Tax=Arundo donax TaxID=35708 RepID=A0A0A9B5X3_ARUDO